MQGLRWLALGLLVTGAALIAASVAIGEGRVYLVLFIPVYAGNGAVGLFGVLAITVGLFLTLFGPAWRSLLVPLPSAPSAASPPTPSDVPAGTPPATYGGVVMLGPIPIAFGSNARIARWMMILGLVFAAFVIAAFLILSFAALP